MQFNLALTAAAGRCPTHEQSTVPQFLSMLQSSPRMQALREQEGEHERERLEREQAREREDLVHGGSSGARAQDAAMRAERRMEPGSGAWRRAQIKAHHREQVEQRSAEFRSALNRAAESRSGSKPAVKGETTKGDVGAQTKGGQEAGGQGKVSGAARGGEGEQGSAVKGSATRGVQLPTTVAMRSAAVLMPTQGQANPPLVAGRSGLSADARGVARVGKAGGGGNNAGGVRSSGSSLKPGGVQHGFNVSGGARASRTGGKSGVAAQGAREAADGGKNDTNMARLLRTIHLRLGRERSSATLRLDPPELGKVKLQMELRNESLTLQIEAQTVQARRLLTEHLDALRQSLESSGVHLERVDLRVAAPANVEPGADDASQPDVQSGQQEASSRSDGEAAGGGTSTGTEADGVEVDTMSAEALVDPLAEPGVDVLA